MRRTTRVIIANNMLSIFDYVRRRLQKNAGLDEMPTLSVATRLVGEESIIDGDTVIFRIPNGNPKVIRKRMEKSI